MLIIFDLDDTLIDTSGCITHFKLEDALNAMVSQGLPVVDFRESLHLLKTPRQHVRQRARRALGIR